MYYNMENFLGQCVERYCKLAKVPIGKLSKVATPFMDETKEDEQETVRGELQPIAAKVLMKVLYAARMARFDLLRPTCALACLITKWTATADKRLHRLMSYIHHSKDMMMSGYVGDDVHDIRLALYGNADFAGDA